VYSGFCKGERMGQQQTQTSLNYKCKLGIKVFIALKPG
jgi:hypothetical protein